MKITRLLLALVLASAGLYGACTSGPGPVEPTAPSVLDGSGVIGSGQDTTTTSSDTTSSDTTGTGG